VKGALLAILVAAIVLFTGACKGAKSLSDGGDGAVEDRGSAQHVQTAPDSEETSNHAERFYLGGTRSLRGFELATQ
jgi:outer membrane protein assembly factor BamA